MSLVYSISKTAILMSALIIGFSSATHQPTFSFDVSGICNLEGQGLTSMEEWIIPEGVKQLNLKNNEIKALSASTQYPSTFEALILDFNQIDTIEEGLQLPASLQKLSLRNNRITVEQLRNLNGPFSALAELRTVNLDSNQIENVHGIQFADSITKLGFENNNKLNSFAPANVPANLNELLLRNTHIGLGTLHLLPFAQMTQLTKLTIDGNFRVGQTIQGEIKFPPTIETLHVDAQFMIAFVVDGQILPSLQSLATINIPVYDEELLGKGLEELKAEILGQMTKQPQDVTFPAPKRQVETGYVQEFVKHRSFNTWEPNLDLRGLQIRTLEGIRLNDVEAGADYITGLAVEHQMVASFGRVAAWPKALRHLYIAGSKAAKVAIEGAISVPETVVRMNIDELVMSQMVDDEVEFPQQIISITLVADSSDSHDPSNLQKVIGYFSDGSHGPTTQIQVQWQAAPSVGGMQGLLQSIQRPRGGAAGAAPVERHLSRLGSQSLWRRARPAATAAVRAQRAIEEAARRRSGCPPDVVGCFSQMFTGLRGIRCPGCPGGSTDVGRDAPAQLSQRNTPRNTPRQ